MLNILVKFKNQNVKKLSIIIYNFMRVLIIKIFHPKNFIGSFLQNIHPSTVIAINGHLRFSHSIFTRQNVTFRVEGGFLDIGTSFFNQGCCITCLDSIKIGNGCLFGPNVVIVDHDHNFKVATIAREGAFKCSEVVIGNNVWIGANCVVLRGTRIGDNCVIGAGTIVKGDFPANTRIISKQSMYLSEIN